MSADRTDLLLDSIREAATNAVTFIEGLDLSAFVADRRCCYAVSMCLVVIGENAARLLKYHPEFVAAHPETPWSQAIGMRNRIARGYDQLDFAIVFRTVSDYLPDFLRTLPASRPLEEQPEGCSHALAGKVLAG